jgi:CysZ protein
MLVRSFLLALQSLSDRRIMRLLLKSIGATLLLLAAAGFALWMGFSQLLEKFHVGFVSAGAVIAVLAIALLAWLSWRVIAISVLWFFSDDIVDAVEGRYYPTAALARNPPNIKQSAIMALRSLARVIGYNLLASPVYLVLLFTGIGAALALLLVNALLLGRDLEDMLALRHGPKIAAMGKVNRMLLGLVGTAGMLVPFVNLLVPVVAVAMAVHMAHKVQIS